MEMRRNTAEKQVMEETGEERGEKGKGRELDNESSDGEDGRVARIEMFRREKEVKDERKEEDGELVEGLE